MGTAKKIGEMLVEEGLINEVQLRSALYHQQKWGGLLGACMVHMGFVTERAMGQVLAKQLNFEHADLFTPGIPDAVLNLVKADLVKKYHLLPVKLDGKTLQVALSDPMNIEAIDMVRFATGLKIKPVFALEAEIADAIATYYDGKQIEKKRDAVPFRQAAAAQSGEAESNAGFVLGEVIEDDRET